MVTRSIPEVGTLRVFASASITTRKSLEAGTFDRQGYVRDLNGSEPIRNRDDVAPLFEATLPLSDDDHDDLMRVIIDLGSCESSDALHLAAMESVIHDYTTDEGWLYALHASVDTVIDGKPFEVSVLPTDYASSTATL